MIDAEAEAFDGGEDVVLERSGCEFWPTWSAMQSGGSAWRLTDTSSSVPWPLKRGSAVPTVTVPDFRKSYEDLSLGTPRRLRDALAVLRSIFRLHGTSRGSDSVKAAEQSIGRHH